MDLARLQEELARFLKGHPDIQIVYLFGSQARAETNSAAVGPLSDYDFGILVDWTVPKRDRDTIQSQLALAMARRLQTDRIDVVILNDAPVELAYAVIAEGRVLCEQSLAVRVDYEAYVLGRYGDYLPILREQRRQILQGDDYEKRVQRYRETFRRTRRKISETRRE